MGRLVILSGNLRITLLRALETLAMTTAKKLMTASELLALPDDGKRYELIRGVLITMAPASAPHGAVTDRIGRRIGNFVEANNLGKTYAAETGVFIEHGPDTVRAPDYAFTSR